MRPDPHSVSDSRGWNTAAANFRGSWAGERPGMKTAVGPVRTRTVIWEREKMESEQNYKEKLAPIFARYQDDKCSLIDIMQEVQAEYGYLPVDAIYEISAHPGVSPATIKGVATFYSQFRLTPIGKYLVTLCQGTACHVNGSEQIRKALCEELKIQCGETTEDGMFTLQDVACLGCCSLSPAMMINGNTYGSLTPDKAIRIVRDLKKGAEA